MKESFRAPDRPGENGAGRVLAVSPLAERLRSGEGARASFKEVDGRLVSLVARDSFEAEQYRGLRLMVERMHKPGEGTVVAVCSPAPGDGKSITAINLAGALAQDLDAQVLLIEADLHRPASTINDYLKLRGMEPFGLVDITMEPSLVLEDAVQRLRPFNLSVLLSGSHTDTPYEVLKSPRLEELLADARRRYDYVILDLPPVVPVPDCRLVEEWIDGFFMVVAAHQTPRRMLEEALNLIKPEKVLGLVFNGHDRMDSMYYGYDRAYAYSGSKGRKKRHGEQAPAPKKGAKPRPWGGAGVSPRRNG